jgi:hypothetical protein
MFRTAVTRQKWCRVDHIVLKQAYTTLDLFDVSRPYKTNVHTYICYRYLFYLINVCIKALQN